MHNLQHSTKVEPFKGFILQIPEEHRSNSGIYLITNTINGHVYVGSAVHLRKRYNKHVQHIRVKRNACPKLQQAAYKYGLENFVFSLLELCDRAKLIEREQYWIDFYNSAKKGYNSCPQAGTTAGRVMSDETKQKLRAVNLGKRRVFREQKPKRKKGDPLSDETKRKISEKNKGKKRSLEHCLKLRGENNKNAKTVYQYTPEGELLKVWKGIKTIQAQTGYEAAAIARCAKGEQRFSYGFVWCFCPIFKTPEDDKKLKPILQYTTTGVLIKRWISSKEAYDELGLNHRTIRKCASGIRKTAYGYIWRYEKA